ncbi:MAG: type II secretion system protein [Thermodesulfobacteriota bacterium]|nr:type II secretion system protein [Thermodesulfobacteriota bacterium]
MKTKLKQKSGFTIIELVVVLSIIGMVLFFVLPKFQAFQIFSDSGESVGKILKIVEDLKTAAVAKNRDFIMHIDSEAGLIWITNDSMTDDEIDQARENGIRISDEITIFDVEFFGRGLRESESSGIRFSRHGYSDMALIHLQDQENDITIRIEPFLAKAEIEKRHVSFEECI